jgi:hypothetical protein
VRRRTGECRGLHVQRLLERVGLCPKLAGQAPPFMGQQALSVGLAPGLDSIRVASQLVRRVRDVLTPEVAVRVETGHSGPGAIVVRPRSIGMGLTDPALSAVVVGHALRIPGVCE